MGNEENRFDNSKLKAYCEELKQRVGLNNKILLIKGPQFNIDAFELRVAKNRCYYAYPPTGLQYLAQALEGRGLNIKILDLNFELLKKLQQDNKFDYKNWMIILEDYLKKHNPSIIGVSNLFSVDIPKLMEILEYLKDKDKIILAGGQNATYEGEKFLKEGLCNFIFQREAENKINFLFDSLFEDKGSKPTPGILFKYKGVIEETNGERDRVELKGNLIKAHELVPIEEYCKVGSISPYARMSGKDNVFATIVFNRGCEGGCRFCGVCDYMGLGVRSRKVEDALDELEYLNKERGVKHFELLDDDFAIFKNKALAFLQGIIDRRIKMTWASNNGFIIRTLDEELIEKMKESGCMGFKVGIESGNAEILKEIRKPGTLEIFRDFSKKIKRFPELFLSDYYIVSFPNENFGKMMETYRFSLEMDLDWSTFSVYQPHVNYYGDEERRGEKKDNLIGDFLPGKDALKGQLESSEKIYSGLKVFDIPYESIPSKEQLGQIWFTFNFVRNFIQNKNLKNGNPEKYIRWVSAVEERYPTHPYINLPLALAYLLVNNKKEADRQYKKMIKNLEDNYWKKKFEEFELIEIVNNFPQNSEQAREVLNSLMERYRV